MNRYNRLTETMFVKLVRIFTMLLLAASVAIFAIAKPHTALTRVTVDQFDALLARISRQNDGEVTHAIAQLVLTERPSRNIVNRWEAQMPGKRSSEALRTLVDVAAFLKPPAADVLQDPKPDAEEQSAMVARVTEYVRNTVHKLPNFSATRSETEFEIASQDDLASTQFNQQFFNKKNAGSPKPHLQDLGAAGVVPDGHLYLDGTWEHTVTYRNGSEVTEKPDTSESKQAGPWFSTIGEFGPILSTVIDDSSHGKIEWSHWERSAAGTLAVFHYDVPRSASHYSVESKLSSDVDLPAYHGEIAVDPSTGTIYRIAVQSWMQEPAAAEETGIEVEYGPVTIGNSAYICPIHGVAYWKMYPPFVDENADPVPRFVGLNDVTFTQYHVFRSESRILTGPGL